MSSPKNNDGNVDFHIKDHTIFIKEVPSGHLGERDWNLFLDLKQEKIEKIVCQAPVLEFSIPSSCNHTLKTVELAEGVLSLDDAAFLYCKELTSIVLPDSITTIPTNCFYECSSLTHVTLGKDVKTIEKGAFSKCVSLKSINFPESLESIGNEAFSKCESLKSIRLSQNIKNIGNEAFCGCAHLSTIDGNGFDFGDIHADAFKNTLFLNRLRLKNPLVIYDNCVLDGLYCKGNVIVPEGVTSICSAAFKNNRYLTGIKLPDTIDGISYSAFEGCVSLTDIKLPAALNCISQYLFKDCISLERIVFPTKINNFYDDAFINTPWLKTHRATNPLVVVRDYLVDAKRVKDVVHISGVKTIVDSSFKKNIDIKEVIIEEGVERIDSSAFNRCYFLEKVTLPQSIKEIGSYAFANCAYLKEIVLPNSLETISKGLFFRCYNLEKVVLPANLKKIEDDAFWGCPNLTQLSIDTQRVEVGDDVFGKRKESCPIRMVAHATKKKIDGRYTLVINRNSNHEREELVEVIIPEGVEVIEHSAFKACKKLLRVHLPESLKVIEEQAFYECTSLQEINMPSQLTKIGFRAFGETAITEIEFPDSLKSIESYAFCDSELRKVTINSSVEIDYWGTCENLYELTLHAPITTKNRNPFEDCPYLTNVDCEDANLRKRIMNGRLIKRTSDDYTHPFYWSAFALGYIAVAVWAIVSFFKGDDALYTQLGWTCVALFPAGLIVNKLLKLLGLWRKPREGKSSRLGQLLYAPALLFPAAIIGVPIVHFTHYPGLFCYTATSGAIVSIVLLVDFCLNLFKAQFTLFFTTVYSLVYRFFKHFLWDTVIVDFLFKRVLCSLCNKILGYIIALYHCKFMKRIRRKVKNALLYLIDNILLPISRWLKKVLKVFFRFLWEKILSPFFQFIRDTYRFIKHVVLDYILRPTIKFLIKASKKIWLVLLRPFFRLLTRFFVFLYKHLVLGLAHIAEEIFKLIFRFILKPIGRVLHWIYKIIYNYFLKYLFAVIVMQCKFLYRQLSNIFSWIFNDANGVVNYFITIPLLILAVIGAIVYYFWFR